jgi:CAAX prenyl protease-like protein
MNTPAAPSGNEGPDPSAAAGGAGHGSPGPGREAVAPGSDAAPPRTVTGAPLQRGPRVFGRFAFWITVVPFLIYLIGTFGGTYVENQHKRVPAHKMHETVRFMAESLLREVQRLPDAGQRAEVDRQLGLTRLKDLLNSENAGLDEVELAAQRFLKSQPDQVALPDPVLREIARACVEDRLEGEYSDSAHALGQLQGILSHHLDLRRRAKEGDLDAIRSAHEEFLGQTVSDPHYAAERYDWFPEHRSWYPSTYTITCVATLIAVVLVFPGYLKAPLRSNWLGVGVGVVGIFVWIGLWYLDKNLIGLGAWLAPNARAAFNPFEELRDYPSWMYQFLAIRFVGLVLLVPLVEEFFLRGFLMRYIDDIDWDEIPLGVATWKAVIGVLVYAALSHTGEPLAAIAWFGLVTWLYLRTGSIWDCVVAHSVTNLLLGLFVLATGTWELW